MRGRYPDGAEELLEPLDGSSEDKQRAQVILETVFAAARVKEACAKLGIGETRFRQLRDLALQGVLDGIRLRPAGRPSRRATADAARVDELEQVLAGKELELQQALVREEVALILPQRVESRKKGRRSNVKLRRQKPR